MPPPPGAPGDEVEAGLPLAGVAPPARVIVNQSHPIQVGPDAGVANQELVDPPGQLLSDVA